MKPISYESYLKGQGAAEVDRRDEGSRGERRGQPPGATDSHTGVGQARVKPKGTSIALSGCGKRDGSDVNNSMGLVEAYRDVVLPRRPGESRWPREVDKIERKPI